MAEPYLNIMILVLCRPEVRNDREAYAAFVREVPERIAPLSRHCLGFARSVSRTTDTYRAFMRVIDKRNCAIHGNIDPVRETMETVYFEGKRPLYVDSGDDLAHLFDMLEALRAADRGPRRRGRARLPS